MNRGPRTRFPLSPRRDLQTFMCPSSSSARFCSTRLRSAFLSPFARAV